jgi:hypothetical protein
MSFKERISEGLNLTVERVSRGSNSTPEIVLDINGTTGVAAFSQIPTIPDPVDPATAIPLATSTETTFSRQVYYVNPIAEELITIAADALCANGVVVLTAAQPDYPRCLALRITIAVNPITAGIATVVGVGPSGEAISEAVSLIAAISKTVYTDHAFATVTSITVSGKVGGAGAGDNLSVGVSSKLGLPASVSPAPTSWAVHKANVANANEAVGTVDADYGTIDPTTPPDATADFSFFYTYTVNPT